MKSQKSLQKKANDFKITKITYTILRKVICPSEQDMTRQACYTLAKSFSFVSNALMKTLVRKALLC